ncbi:MAG TPA: hypothetical protein VJH96_04095 [Patescibacteria group bacterium]|nr:hypothetical protein [Patescibacteria group bacterium]
MYDYLNKNIVKTLGLHTLPREKQEEMLVKIGDIIFQNILLRVMGELDEAGSAELDRMLTEKKTDEEVFNFLSRHIPQLDELVKEEIVRFKEETTDFMTSLFPPQSS